MTATLRQTEPAVLEHVQGTPTPSPHARVLDFLGAHGHTGSGALIAALPLNAAKLAEVLDDLMEVGKVRALSGGYALTTFDYDRRAARPDKEEALLAHLLGRRDSAHGVARALRLSHEAGRATCEALRERGVLSAKCVGNLLLYTLA